MIPIQHTQIPGLFEIERPENHEHLTFYKLNTRLLPEKQCHVFFRSSECEELLVLQFLEHNSFKPNTPLNEHYHIQFIQLDSTNICWCSFPINFKDTCKKMAKVFGFEFEEKPLNPGLSH